MKLLNSPHSLQIELDEEDINSMIEEFECDDIEELLEVHFENILEHLFTKFIYMGILPKTMLNTELQVRCNVISEDCIQIEIPKEGDFNNNYMNNDFLSQLEQFGYGEDEFDDVDRGCSYKFSSLVKAYDAVRALKLEDCTLYKRNNAYYIYTPTYNPLLVEFCIEEYDGMLPSENIICKFPIKNKEN